MMGPGANRVVEPESEYIPTIAVSRRNDSGSSSRRSAAMPNNNAYVPSSMGVAPKQTSGYVPSGMAAPSSSYVPSGMGGARRPRFNPNAEKDEESTVKPMKMNLS
jgi:hypothetical protein